jgi:hypothetical protein
MIKKTQELLADLEKYADTEELAGALEAMKEDCPTEHAYWLQESAQQLRGLFDLSRQLASHIKLIDRA